MGCPAQGFRTPKRGSRAEGDGGGGGAASPLPRRWACSTNPGLIHSTSSSSRSGSPRRSRPTTWWRCYGGETSALPGRTRHGRVTHTLPSFCPTFPVRSRPWRCRPRRPDCWDQLRRDPPTADWDPDALPEARTWRGELRVRSRCRFPSRVSLSVEPKGCDRCRDARCDTMQPRNNGPPGREDQIELKDPNDARRTAKADEGRSRLCRHPFPASTPSFFQRKGGSLGLSSAPIGFCSDEKPSGPSRLSKSAAGTPTMEIQSSCWTLATRCLVNAPSHRDSSGRLSSRRRRAWRIDAGPFQCRRRRRRVWVVIYEKWTSIRWTWTYNLARPSRAFRGRLAGPVEKNKGGRRWPECRELLYS